MKVRLHPGDQRGVGFNRMIWPGTAAGAHPGIEIDFAQNLAIQRQPAPNGRQAIRADPIDADVLVFQRVSNPEVLALLPELQARGHAIVMDVDDDLHSLPTANAAYGQENPRMVLKACALADLVTVTTPALAARYAPHGRYRVLPNCVPAAILDLPRQSDGRTVGWGGWIGTHPGDLPVTRGGVAEAVRRADARFQVVGPGDGVASQLGLDTLTATGPLTNVAAFEFEQALGELDVGIVPLADTKFNAAKSWLKGIQYAARGVPFVASPAAEYRKLASEGVGVLAAPRARNWRAQVLELLTNESLRAEMAERGRAVVTEHHTYEANAYQWIEAWDWALKHRRAMGARAAA